MSGSLSALGLAYSIQIIPDLSVGVTLNIWDDELTNSGWKSKNTVNIYNSFMIASTGMSERTRISRTLKDEYAFQGVNFNIGAIWRTARDLTVGLVFKSPFTADISHDRELSVVENGEIVSDAKSSSEEEMRMPMSYGLGAAWRTSDYLTISMDVYRTHWEDLKIEDENGNGISPITNKALEDADIDPTWQFRIGMEYLLMNPEVDYVVPLRCGFFYDPAPAVGSPDDYYGFSLGSGFGMGRVVFDMAYQYRYGNNVGESLVDGSDFSQDVEEHLIYSSFIFHF